MLQNYNKASNISISVNNRLQQLRILEGNLTISISQAPEGKMRLSKHRGKTTYYRELFDHEAGCNRSKYIKQSEMELISKLAQKGYEKDLLERVKKQIGILEKMSQHDLESDDLDQVYFDLHDARKVLVNPYRLPDDDYIKNWNDAYQREITENGKQNIFHSESLRFTTNNKELVRSKSELIIADRLLEYNIPYHYEQKLILNNGFSCYPDFTILDVSTRKQIYWEHFGMVDNKNYSNSMVEKLERYLKNGILLGEDLIVTMETSDHPLDKTIIDETIKKYLVH